MECNRSRSWLGTSLKNVFTYLLIKKTIVQVVCIVDAFLEENLTKVAIIIMTKCT